MGEASLIETGVTSDPDGKDTAVCNSRPPDAHSRVVGFVHFHSSVPEGPVAGIGRLGV